MKPTDLLSRSEFSVEDGNAIVVTIKGCQTNIYNMDSDPFCFHFAQWLATNDYRNFSMFSKIRFDDDDEPTRIILFGSQEEHDDFASWLKDYKMRFPDGNFEQVCWPRIPKSGTVKLTFVNLESDDDDDGYGGGQKSTGRAQAVPKSDDTLFETWGWVLHNCKSNVYRISDAHYAFEDENEAFLFKMLNQ